MTAIAVSADFGQLNPTNYKNDALHYCVSLSGNFNTEIIFNTLIFIIEDVLLQINFLYFLI